MTHYPVSLAGTSDKVHMWAQPETVEDAALQQICEIARLPEVHGVRVMPDVHLGKGATVGSVIAMQNALAPAAVGVDIGCGVAAIKTNLHSWDLVKLGELRASIEKAIPVGFNSHDVQAPTWMLDNSVGALMGSFHQLRADVGDRQERAWRQLGTLGGGNHFIELCLDDSDAVWLTLHSGSRNIGKEIAERHITKAKGLKHNEDHGDMAVFYGGTEQMGAYLHDLRWAQAYAAENRATMMNLLKEVVTLHFAWAGTPRVTFGQEINVHHNYVAEEIIDGETMLVTRKGAIRAGAGELAMIPGSMGTGSFIVEGLGSAESYYSASHGAGRRMSRTKAKKAYTTADLAFQTRGIECRKDSGVVDEIPAAYKSIESVIEAQSDLVRPVARLRTLLCVKG